MADQNYFKMTKEKQYIHYGCGLSAPKEWKNFDTSPTLRLQKLPLIGTLVKGRLNAVFPDNVFYGDIVKGLPLEENSCDAVYCSHVLEHLALKDFRTALLNTYKILKPNGIFRCVLPDLEVICREYLKAVEGKDPNGSINFMGKGSLLGLEERPKGIKGFLTSYLGNAKHLWMWDHVSLEMELSKVGFKNIRKASFNDSSVGAFKFVENKERFESAVALEAVK